MALDETTLPLLDTELSDHDTPSPTEHLLDALQLHGYRPFQDEPDPRPLPDPQIAQGLLYDSFDALVALMSGTRWRTTSPTSCGRWSTCSTAGSTGSGANSTTTSRRSGAAKQSRTARR